MSAVQSSHAAVAERRVRADDPRPRADERRLPAEPPGCVERSGDRDRLLLATVGGRDGDVAREQAALPQLDYIAAQRPGESPTGCLHITDPRRRALHFLL